MSTEGGGLLGALKAGDMPEVRAHRGPVLLSSCFLFTYKAKQFGHKFRGGRKLD